MEGARSAGRSFHFGLTPDSDYDTGMENSKRQFADVTEAWVWLTSHPAFEAREILLSPKRAGSKAVGIKAGAPAWLRDNTFAESLYIEFVRINPQTGAIDEDATKNTQIEVWLEGGAPVEDEDSGVRYRVSHNHHLDCGGPTFEAALLQMATNVLECYGDYEMDENAVGI